MKRIVTLLFTVAALAVAATAFATPVPNGAFFSDNLYGDCDPLFGVVTHTNNYPSLVQIDYQWICTSGYAQLNAWSFSEDGGATDVHIMNGDAFRFGADVTASGPGECEVGIRTAPWWYPYGDGRINCRTTDGEIACFGGRMPFYSFTGTNGLHYVKGTTIHLEMIYKPNGLSSTEPGTMEYVVRYNGTTYASGPLPFDEGNAAEGKGTWGCLNDARAGGQMQSFIGGMANSTTGKWENVFFTTLPTATKSSTWGQLKNLYK
jgi:hypothetical protein